MSDIQLTEHIQNERLRSFYDRMHDSPYENIEINAFNDLRTEIERKGDKGELLALYYGARECVRVILEDIGEHGEQNKDLHGGYGAEFFDRILEQGINKKIDELEQQGTKTAIFSEWKRKYDAWIDKSATDFMDEMEVNEQMINKLKMQNENPEGTLEVLKEVAKLIGLSPEEASAVNGVVSNGILVAVKAGKYALAMDIVRTYGEANAYRMFRLGDEKTEEMLLTHLLAVPGFTGKKEDISFVLEKILPLYVLDTYPRAFFNAACLYALNGDKNMMLDAIKKAVAQADKTKQEFLDDSSFKAYLADPDFLAAIGEN